MKRNTPQHPKTTALMAELKLPRFAAVGLLEMLWHFTAVFAVQGDIGRHSDAAIAEAVGWELEPAVLSAALIHRRWLDACPCHRLRVHDWPHHADQQTSRAAAKVGGFLSCYVPDVGLAAVPLPLPLPSPALPCPAQPAGEPPHVALREYVRAVAAAFFAASERPETQGLDSVEYSLACKWHSQGIPFRIVVRAITDTKGRGRRLQYYGPSVEEAFSTWFRATGQSMEAPL